MQRQGIVSNRYLKKLVRHGNFSDKGERGNISPIFDYVDGTDKKHYIPSLFFDKNLSQYLCVYDVKLMLLVKTIPIL